MSSIKEFMTTDHRECDDLLAGLEADFGSAKEAFGPFEKRFLDHFDMEEKVLFPAFEEATGMSGGPTEVMRMEHSQMRNMIEQMRAAIDANDADRFASVAETFLFLVQQHNSKEEQILYTMADRTLSDQSDALIDKMKAF
jgi:hemerythrin-like domain-containing protein